MSTRRGGNSEKSYRMFTRERAPGGSLRGKCGERGGFWRVRVDRAGEVCYNKFGRTGAGGPEICRAGKGETMENNKHSKVASIVAYLWWIGWIVAYVIRDKSDRGTTQHLNQALVAAILEVISMVLIWIPVIGIVGYLIQVAAWILALWGLIRAIMGNDEPMPIIGGISIIK